MPYNPNRPQPELPIDLGRRMWQVREDGPEGDDGEDPWDDEEDEDDDDWDDWDDC